MYAGLTTADKGALLDADQSGFDWVSIRQNGSMCFSVGVPNYIASMPIKEALAQIAEMESKPLTWNDRINQMTVDEKAKYFVAVKWRGSGSVYIAIDNSIHDRRKRAENRNKKILNSPYTEGEKE